ncbi:MAG: glycosyltransferase family 39 protein [Deinococcus sp.]|nr:glycosyltransferase family 39 protein [Deinococcus sp.]
MSENNGARGWHRRLPLLTWRRADQALAAIVVAGLLFRGWWIGMSHAIPVSDAGHYRDLALSLAHGDGYQFHGVPTAWWVPGWPFFLSLLYRVFGEDDTVIHASNLGLALLTLGLTLIVADRIFNRSTAALATGIAALFPSLILLPEYFLSENLAVPGLLLITLLAISVTGRLHPLAAGFLVGMGSGVLVYIREANFTFLPAVLLYWALQRQGRRQLALHSAGLALGVFVVLVPWVIRNSQVLGVATMSTSAGVNLWISFHPQATGGYVPVPLDAWEPGTAQNREAWYHTYGSYSAIHYVWEHPQRVIELAPRKLAAFLFDEWWPWWLDQDATGQPTLGYNTVGFRAMLMLLSGYYLVVLALAAAFPVFWQRRARIAAERRAPEVLFLLGIVLFPALLHAFIFGNGRFHAPLVPIFSMLAAYVVTEVVPARARSCALR